MARLLIVAMALSVAGAAAAQSTTGTVTTKMVRTGWSSDSFALVTVQPIINPAGCSSPDGYVSSNAMPGYQTYLAASLAAFSLDAPITISVDNTKCLSGRPVIIGVNIIR